MYIYSPDDVKPILSVLLSLFKGSIPNWGFLPGEFIASDSFQARAIEKKPIRKHHTTMTYNRTVFTHGNVVS